MYVCIVVYKKNSSKQFSIGLCLLQVKVMVRLRKVFLHLLQTQTVKLNCSNKEQVSKKNRWRDRQADRKTDSHHKHTDMSTLNSVPGSTLASLPW